MSSLTVNKSQTMDMDIDIELVADRSGSMISQGTAPSTGIKEFLQEQQKTARENSNKVQVYLSTFDDTVETPWSTLDLVNCTLPNEDQLDIWLKPRGGTKLFDSVVERSQIQQFRAETKKKIFAVLTDGEDTSSELEENGRPALPIRLHKAISSARKKGVECIFLAANQDAVTTGTSYGFSPHNCLTTARTPDSVKALRSLSYAVTRAQTNLSPSFTSQERTISAPIRVRTSPYGAIFGNPQ